MNSKDLRNQVRGLVLSLCFFALFITWSFKGSPLLRYTVIGFIVILIVAWIILAALNKSRLRALRSRHLKDYDEASSTETSGDTR